ncbi:MAG: tetratricopeptide repeat-containing sensor histidine kinase [Ferruginibacter sp.]|nr:tetratricopeptide repeat-containing sensor histidine kinase [Ferruginibacter sp.]
MQKLLTAILLMVAFSLYAQMDTASINALYKKVKNYYDRNDSIRYYAGQIQASSETIKYREGIFFALRLKGIASQNEEDNKKAIAFFLEAIKYAEENNLKQLASNAHTDIGSSFITLQFYDKAIDAYNRALTIAKELNDYKIESICYNSLGICLRHQKKYDEAIAMYKQAEALKKSIGDTKGLVAAKNNIGSLYIFTDRHNQALPYFLENYEYDKVNGTDADLYFDYVNMGAAYEGTGNDNKALQYYDSALACAKRTGSKEKEAACYEQFSGYYKKKKIWNLAYDYVEKYQVAYKEFIDEKSHNAIAEMQEKYDAGTREKDNSLLQANLKESKLQKTLYGIGALGAVLVAIAIGFALRQNKKARRKAEEQNALIQKQNSKLTELNAEKNSLISVVSHDLSSPFASISTWNNVLAKDTDTLSDEQVLAVSKIKMSVQNGEQLIKRILDIDRIEMASHQLKLENINAVNMMQETVSSFSNKALEKNLQLHFTAGPENIPLLTDKELLRRIAENLLSNAIKFSPPGKNIYTKLYEDGNNVCIEIKDEGVGIPADELPHLFVKYSSISSKPTAGEASNGLGLSIVKRMADELNGSIAVSSQEGKGSCFTVTLKK